MSAPLTAGRIAEHALRQIGAFSTNDTGADPAQFQVALERLDIIVAELASTEALSWLIDAGTEIELVAGQSVYPLAGIEHVTAVRYAHDGHRLEPVNLVRLSEFALLDTASGDPQAVTVTRDPDLSLEVWPPPAAAQADITLTVTGQAYAPDLVANRGRDAHGLPSGWARFLIYTLAADIGSGPVHMLAPGTIQGFEQRAAALKSRLTAHSNRDQLIRPRVVKYRDF